MKASSIGFVVLVPIVLFGTACQRGNSSNNSGLNDRASRTSVSGTDTNAAGNSSLPSGSGTSNSSAGTENRPVATIHALSSADTQGTSKTNTSGPAAYQDSTTTGPARSGVGNTITNSPNTNQTGTATSGTGVNGAAIGTP